MRILLIRMMGLGDVASILVPAAYIYKQRHPFASITALTYEAGGEIMSLHPAVNEVITIGREDWPNDLLPTVQRFIRLGESIAAEQFDLIVNLDTWFMPCFLARALRDTGSRIEGNYLNQEVASFLQSAVKKEVEQAFFEKPSRYLESTFSNMGMWHQIWWEEQPNIGYPNFYLNTCCGFDEAVRIDLPCAPDQNLLNKAQRRPIVALSTRGRAEYKHYRHSNQFVDILERRGIFCWSQFDGSAGMQTTLNRLCASDLLVTVPTSSQWLGRLAGCPSFMLPGPMPTSFLDAEFYPPRQTSCQYCYQEKHCPANRDFECMDISPADLADQILGILESLH